jgi:heme O synthase-like polyprenyltransferase
MNHVVAPLHFQDLGKLLLTLVMLWAYFAFSQFLIIWSGNLPEEIGWYLVRTRGIWGAIILAVVILHFALPFLFLLSRRLKRDPHKLVMVAALILVMRLIDLFWMLGPAFTGEHFHVSWLDVVAPIAVGGLWLSMFAWELSKRSLIPINDPQYESVLEQAHAGH